MEISIRNWVSRAAALLLALACYQTLTSQVADSIRRMAHLTGGLRQGSLLPAWSPDAIAFVVWALVVLAVAYALFDLRESRPRIYGAIATTGAAVIGGVVGLRFQAQGLSVDQSLAALGGAFGAVDGIAAIRKR